MSAPASVSGAPDALREQAKAKVNLSLNVLGRRADGFHELAGLVAFASIGDELRLIPAKSLSLEIDGRFADALEGDAANLVLRAAQAVARAAPGSVAGTFTLTKNLPVGAGLGGGSSDAAAALRLLARVNPGALDEGKLTQLAALLGADVSVCLAQRASMIWGRGEKTAAIAGMPPLPCVLVNPGVALSTAQVFARGSFPPLVAELGRPAMPAGFANVSDFARHLGALRNDLERAATELVPEIATTKNALSDTAGCLHAAMTGSGATCFGLFASEQEASAAARSISRAHRDWWVVATTLA